jgi:lipopolysaccharide export LptBFGC system permease protein LptF
MNHQPYFKRSMILFPAIIIRHWVFAWIGNLGISFFFFASVLVLFTISEDLNQYDIILLDQPFRAFQIILFPYIPWIVPVCCFTSTILTFYVFENNLEWSGLKACSVSPYWVTGAIFTLGLLVSLLLSFSTIFDEQLSHNSTTKIKSGFSMKAGKESSWFFQSFNSSKMEGQNLQVYLYEGNGDDALRLRCSRATWNESKGWTFYDGVYLSFLTKRGLPIPNNLKGEIEWINSGEELFFVNRQSNKTPLRKVKFKKLEVKELKESPIPHLLASENPKKLSYLNLRKVLAEYPEPGSKLLSPLRFRYAQMSVSLISSAIATFIALLIVSSSERLNLTTTLSLVLCGVVVFYVSTRFANSLGTRGVLNEWISALLPYFLVISLFFLFKIKDRCM